MGNVLLPGVFAFLSHLHYASLYTSNATILYASLQIFSQIETGEESQELNRCTFCDERRCGIAFVECAGANRRRSGILSDIERDLEQEVCQEVEGPWWRNATIQNLWEQ